MAPLPPSPPKTMTLLFTTMAAWLYLPPLIDYHYHFLLFLYQFHAQKALFQFPKIGNINFLIENDPTPFGTFTKIHLIWWRDPSLTTIITTLRLSVFSALSLFIFLSFYVFAFLSFCLFIFLSFGISVFLYFCLSIFSSFCVFIFLSFHLSVFSSFFLFIFRSFHLSVFSSFGLLIFLSFHFSLFQSSCLPLLSSS